MQHYAIKAEIDKRVARQAERTEISADRVLKEYAKVAFTDARNFIDESGETRAIHDLSPDDSAAIQYFEEQPDGGCKIKLHSKLKALDSLAKHLGLLQPDAADEAREAPSLKIFCKYDDGTIKDITENPKAAFGPTAGIQIDVVDASKPSGDADPED